MSLLTKETNDLFLQHNKQEEQKPANPQLIFTTYQEYEQNVLENINICPDCGKAFLDCDCKIKP